MLIPNWKDAWRYLSVQVQGIMSIALVVWVALPQTDRDAILSLLPVDKSVAPALLALGGFIAAVLARVIAQPSLAPPPADPQGPA